MAINFDCYLIDEITAVGDENFKQKSQKVFKEKLGKSQIIMISHSVHAIKSYCDCGIFLRKNNVYYYDNVEELIRDYKKYLSI